MSSVFSLDPVITASLHPIVATALSNPRPVQPMAPASHHCMTSTETQYPMLLILVVAARTQTYLTWSGPLITAPPASPGCLPLAWSYTLRSLHLVLTTLERNFRKHHTGLSHMWPWPLQEWAPCLGPSIRRFIHSGPEAPGTHSRQPPTGSSTFSSQWLSSLLPKCSQNMVNFPSLPLLSQIRFPFSSCSISCSIPYRRFLVVHLICLHWIHFPVCFPAWNSWTIFRTSGGVIQETNLLTCGKWLCLHCTSEQPLSMKLPGSLHHVCLVSLPQGSSSWTHSSIYSCTVIFCGNFGNQLQRQTDQIDGSLVAVDHEQFHPAD